MAQLTLNKLLTKRDGPGPAINRLLSSLDEPLLVIDSGGKLIFNSAVGNELDGEARRPVLYQGAPVGWVVARKASSLKEHIPALLSAAYAQEMEKRSLANEVLDKYRELNLLYRLSDRLITSPQPQAIAAMALSEACPLIDITAGMVVLKQPGREELETIASCGRKLTLKKGALAPGGIIDRVLRTGNGELANDVNAGEYFRGMENLSISILCAPLKTERRVSGAIIMMNYPARPFSAGDLKLLNIIAMQAGPVIEIVQLQQFELERARLERDLYNAHRVQADLLPRRMPVLEGWEIAALWQPARMVGGDFYDFIHFPDGRLGLVVADVTDKGMPAALVMANTRSILRAVAASHGHKQPALPGQILKQANNLLCEDMPQNMFVTCLLVIFDPKSGEIIFANAGHNLPYRRTSQEVIEMRATGVPLGIFSNMEYENKECALLPGESLLMYSDGLPEAHNPQGEMFDYERLRRCLAEQPQAERLNGEALIRELMAELHEFTGPDWEQEDDVTMLVLTRCLS
jgi:serine phosphatase RsbU (regulator of sigma subunit)